MAFLKKEFDSFCKKINIDTEAPILIHKRETLKKEIENNLPDKLNAIGIEVTKSDFEFIHQGSYKINTTIATKPVDIDYAVIVPINITENKDVPKIKKAVKDSLSSIPSRTVIIKEPCVTVSYIDDGEETMHIDFPIYASHYSKLYLARGKENSSQEHYNWEIADPKGLNNYFESILIGNDELRNAIRLIKKWKYETYKNSSNNHEIPPSIALTLLACQNYTHKDYIIQTVYEILLKIKNSFIINRDSDGNIISASINCMLPVEPYTDVFYKMKNSNRYMIRFFKELDYAVRKLKEAIDLEDEHEAGLCVQKVFGEEFEAPKKQAKYVESYNNRESSFG